MSILIAALGALLLLIGLLGARAALVLHDRPARNVGGAAGLVSLLLATACFLSLL
jgi:hypothetical protein